MKSSSEKMQSSEGRSIDQRKIAYQKPQPVGMVPDVFIGSALELDGDEREWGPQSPTLAFRPLVLNVSQGYYINILRVRSSGVLSRHRHSGPVHALTLRGKWRYLEHDWVATPGDYAFEPPGTTHRKWRRASTSQAATSTSTRSASRLDMKTCSPSSSTPSVIMTRSASAR